jgi:hypothetical protein
MVMRSPSRIPLFRRTAAREVTAPSRRPPGVLLRHPPPGSAAGPRPGLNLTVTVATTTPSTPTDSPAPAFASMIIFWTHSRIAAIARNQALSRAMVIMTADVVYRAALNSRPNTTPTASPSPRSPASGPRPGRIAFGGPPARAIAQALRRFDARTYKSIREAMVLLARGAEGAAPKIAAFLREISGWPGRAEQSGWCS